MHTKFLRILFSVTVLLTASVWSQSADQVSVVANINKPEIKIGEKFIYTIEVQYPDSGLIDIPGIQGNLNDFEVRNAQVTNPEKNKDGQMVRIWSLELAAFGSGKFVIPSQTIEYSLKNSKRIVPVYTDSLNISVSSSGGQQMSDIVDEELPLAPEKETPWIFWILITVAVLLLIYIVMRRFHIHSEKANPTLPAYEEAMEELALVRKQNWVHGHQSEYFFALSNILRRYFSRRYEMEALESTSDELIQKMEVNSDFPVFELDRLREFLAQSDLVKFGRVELPESECLHLESYLLHLLESTRIEALPQ